MGEQPRPLAQGQQQGSTGETGREGATRCSSGCSAQSSETGSHSLCLGRGPRMEPGRGPRTQAPGTAGRWARGPPLCPALWRLPEHPPAGREPTGPQRKEAGTKPRTYWMGSRALVTPQACACPEALERHGLWAAPSPHRWPHDGRDHRVWELGGATPALAAPCCSAGPQSATTGQVLVTQGCRCLELPRANTLTPVSSGADLPPTGGITNPDRQEARCPNGGRSSHSTCSVHPHPHGSSLLPPSPMHGLSPC